MDTKKLKDFGTRYTQAWCSHNAASVAAFFSEGGSLKVNAESAAVGRAAITAVAQGFMTAFPDLVVQMDKLTVQDPQVTYHWTLSGTHTGLGGTGSRVRVSGFEEWRFAPDGLIAESIGHFDTVEYQRQLNMGATGIGLSI